jgi:hypothetical protein
MSLNIVRGKMQSPIRGVIYGTEGIGKTTLAGQWPNPLILDTEEGSSRIDCARVVCRDWLTLEGAMHELARDSQGFKTIVVDSADWAERHIIDHLLRKSGKKSIEDFGFGKGYVMLAEHVAKLLSAADQLIDRGMNVVFVAHSKVQRTSPPDETEGFDRWELKLTKHSSPLFKEWCDLLLFCNYRLTLVEGQDGRMKARGGKERVMYAQRAAAWDAKNRFGLPESMPMSIDQLASVIGAAESKPKWTDRVKAAATVEDLGRIADDADEAVSRGELTDDQAAKLRKMIDGRHNEIEPADAEVANA